MPFPVLAALEGLSLAAPAIGGLFKKNRKYGDIPSPDFFGPEFERLLGATRARDQSTFAGVDTNIRESLANSGLLRSGALPDALIRSSIAQGQQIAGDTASLTAGEYYAKRNFDLAKFNALFGAQETQKGRDFAGSKDILDLLGQLGLAGGTLLTQGRKKKPGSYDSTVRNPDGTSVDVTYGKGDDMDLVRRLLGGV